MKPTIARWKARFEERRVDGLEPQHKGSRPPAATPAVQARVIRRVQQKPPDGSTHWSWRKLAVDLNMSHATVQRILAQAKLQPHRLDRYMASNDQDFEQKAADIIGLYINPPQHAAVFCVDEKTAVQALDRLDPVLPLSPAVPNGMVLNTTATVPCRSMRLWMSKRERCRAKPRGGIPVRTLSVSSPVLSQRHDQPKRFTSCWITCPLTRHSLSSNFWPNIPRFGSTLLRPTHRG
jgi:transposase